jgi:hypothetical protein
VSDLPTTRPCDSLSLIESIGDYEKRSTGLNIPRRSVAITHCAVPRSAPRRAVRRSMNDSTCQRPWTGRFTCPRSPTTRQYVSVSH